MKKLIICTIAQLFPTATLACSLMAIQTGNYSLSEKWGWSGFAAICYGLLTLIIQGMLSGI